MRAFIFFMLFQLAFAAPVGAEKSLIELEAANRLLHAELDLARTKQLYFFCDLHDRRLQFKTAGIVLNEIPLVGVRVWGRLADLPVRKVTTKIAPHAPQREKIGQTAEAPRKEKKEAGQPFEIKALEISDMPTSFRLLLDDGLRITVRPLAESVAARWQAKSRLFAWYLAQPVFSNWNFLHGKPYTEMHLTLPAKEAQLFYWSLTEGSPILFALPAKD